VVITHSPKDLYAAPSACTIALAYLELAAPSFGLGACWTGYLNLAANIWQSLKDSLKLPDGHESFGAMMIGYPKYKYQRMPLRNQAKISWR
jgi:nitroreductase